MKLFGTWIAETARLQRVVYRNHPDQLEGEDFSRYIREQTLAAMVELGEFIQNIPWKPWSSKSGRPDMAWDASFRTKRDYAVDELVDVLHFTANLLHALRVTDEELETRYWDKMAINTKRQEEGY